MWSGGSFRLGSGKSEENLQETETESKPQPPPQAASSSEDLQHDTPSELIPSIGATAVTIQNSVTVPPTTNRLEDPEEIDLENGSSDGSVEVVITNVDGPEPVEQILVSDRDSSSTAPLPQTSVRDEILQLLKTIDKNDREMRLVLESELWSLDIPAENGNQPQSNTDGDEEYAERLSKKVRMQSGFENTLRIGRRSHRTLSRKKHHRGFVRSKLDGLSDSKYVVNPFDGKLVKFVACWVYAHVVAGAVTTAIQGTSTAGLFCFPYVGAVALIFDIPFLGILGISSLVQSAVEENGWLGTTTSCKALSVIVIVILVVPLSFTYGIYAVATLPTPILSDSNYGLYAGAIWFYIESIISFVVLLAILDDMWSESEEDWVVGGCFIAGSLPFVSAGIVSAVLQSNAGELYMWPDVGATGLILFGWIPAGFAGVIVGLAVLCISTYVPCGECCNVSCIEDVDDPEVAVGLGVTILGWLGLAIYGIYAVSTLYGDVSDEADATMPPRDSHIGLYFGAVVFYIGICLSGLVFCLGLAALYHDFAEKYPKWDVIGACYKCMSRNCSKLGRQCNRRCPSRCRSKCSCCCCFNEEEYW